MSQTVTFTETDIRAMVSQILGGLNQGEGGPTRSALATSDGPPRANQAVEAPPLERAEPDEPRPVLEVPNPVNRAAYLDMMAATPARIGGWRAGPRPQHRALLRFRADHAAAMDAVFNDVPDTVIEQLGLMAVQTAAADRAGFLMDPNIGARFSPQTAQEMVARCVHDAHVQIVVADGLSSIAVESNMTDLLASLTQGLAGRGLTVGTNLFVKYGRVRIMDEVTALLNPAVTLILIGERPGLVTNESLSCYMTYHGYPGMPENQRTVVSNIYRRGTPPSEAGAYIADIARKMIDTQSSGMNLKL